MELETIVGSTILDESCWIFGKVFFLECPKELFFDLA